MDRQILGFLAPDLQRLIGWNETQYGLIVTSFQGAYAVGLLMVGRLMDRLGSRKGFSLAVALWSLAATSHALARSAFGFGIARFALGVSQGGHFPAAVKTVAEWFPKNERALATGIFTAGSNVGPVVVFLIVPSIVRLYGWQAAFVITGSAGFIFLVIWQMLYRTPDEQSVLAAEENQLSGNQPGLPTSVRWTELLRHKETWALAVGKFLTDPIWWFYLYWLTKFLDKNYGVSLSGLSLPTSMVYLLASFGSVSGGWLSSALIKSGWSINKGRKMAMLLCAVCVVPVSLTAKASSIWIATSLIGLAAAAHQGWSANIFTMASDLFPSEAVASVVGIGGMAGATGGIIFAATTGYILQRTNGNYTSIFVVCGCAYLSALLLVHLLTLHSGHRNLSGSQNWLRTVSKAR